MSQLHRPSLTNPILLLLPYTYHLESHSVWEELFLRLLTIIAPTFLLIKNITFVVIFIVNRIVDIRTFCFMLKFCVYVFCKLWTLNNIDPNICNNHINIINYIWNLMSPSSSAIEWASSSETPSSSSQCSVRLSTSIAEPPQVSPPEEPVVVITTIPPLDDDSMLPVIEGAGPWGLFGGVFSMYSGISFCLCSW